MINYVLNLLGYSSDLGSFGIVISAFVCVISLMLLFDLFYSILKWVSNK